MLLELQSLLVAGAAQLLWIAEQQAAPADGAQSCDAASAPASADQATALLMPQLQLRLRLLPHCHTQQLPPPLMQPAKLCWLLYLLTALLGKAAAALP
jgi:hypothetical protein